MKDTTRLITSAIAGLAVFAGISYYPNATQPATANAPTQQESKKPNIIYILADDLGYGDVGAYGQEEIKTPNIDMLAKQGMQFTQHYSGSTVCGPSRSALMTGQHTGHTFVRFNGDYQLRPDPQDITVARYLKNAGYTTAMIGKSSTGGTTQVGQPNAKGFDLFFGYMNHRAAHTYFPTELYRNTEKLEFPNNGGTDTWRGDTYSSDLFLEEALTFIEAEKDEPFFFILSFTITACTSLGSRRI